MCFGGTGYRDDRAMAFVVHCNLSIYIYMICKGQVMKLRQGRICVGEDFLLVVRWYG